MPCHAWKFVSTPFFGGVDISKVTEWHSLWQMSSHWGSQKLLQLVSHEITAYLSRFNLFLTQRIMTILSKGCKPDNFEPHNSLKLSFTNIQGLHSNVHECEYFLESNSSDILALCDTNLDDSIDSANFSGYLPLIWKDSIIHMHGLAVYVKGWLFGWDLSLENSIDYCLCSRLALLHSVPYFFFLYRSPFFSLYTILISPNIDEVLSVKPSANVLVFADCNVLYKDWLNYSSGTDWPGELYHNFSISSDLTITVLLFWVYFFLLTLVFVLQCLSLHWEILLLSQFPLTFQ